MNMLFPDPTAALERAARLKAKISRIITLTPNAKAQPRRNCVAVLTSAGAPC